MRTSSWALPLTLLIADPVVAQKTIVESRDQAQGWFLPVVCNVSANGGKTDNLHLTIFKDNDPITEIPPEKKKSRFVLELDIDGYYTVRVKKDGYHEKLVYIDTHLPKDQVKYGAYECFVNLEPMDKFAHSDPYYLDFPSAVVRWNEGQKTFTHVDEYVANIQVKMALLGAQMETE